MKLLKNIRLISLFLCILLGTPALGMNAKIDTETELMNDITSALEQLKKANEEKDIKEQSAANKLLEAHLQKIKNVNTALNNGSIGSFSLIQLACMYDNLPALKKALAKADPKSFLVYAHYCLNNRYFALAQELIKKINKNNFNDTLNLALHYKNTKDDKAADLIVKLMSKDLKSVYKLRLAQIKNGQAIAKETHIVNSSGCSHLIKLTDPAKEKFEADLAKTKKQEEEKLQKNKIKIAQIEQNIGQYAQAIEKRFAIEDDIDQKAIVEIIGKMNGQIEELKKHNGAFDIHVQSIIRWQSLLKKEEDLQSKIKIFTQKRVILQTKQALELLKANEHFYKQHNAQKKIAAEFAITHRLSRGLKQLKAYKKPLLNAQNNQLDDQLFNTQAYIMQQVHNDPTWHARYTGDISAIEARKKAVQELDEYNNDKEIWWTMHQKNSGQCVACSNYALAQAHPCRPQKTRRNSL